MGAVVERLLQASNEVNPALLLPPSMVFREGLGVPTAEMVANMSSVESLEAAADELRPWSTENKETLSTVNVLASPELQPSIQHMQVEPAPPTEALSKQKAHQVVGSAHAAGKGFGQVASSWRRMSQDSIPPAPGRAETLSVHATSLGTDSEDLTYAVMEDYSLAELPSQAQVLKQPSISWGGEQQGAVRNQLFAGTWLTASRNAADLMSMQPGPPINAELGTPSSFTFSRHNSGAEIALSPAIFGSRQIGGVLAEARYSLQTNNSWPANEMHAADDTPAAISTHHDGLVLPLRTGTAGLQLARIDQQSLQALPMRSFSVDMGVSRTAEYPSEGADTVAAVLAGKSASSPSQHGTVRPAEAAMQEMRLSDDGEAQRSGMPRSGSATGSSPTAASATLRAAKSGFATFGSSTGLAMGRMGLLSRSAAGQLVKNMSKATAKPNAVSIVRHSSDSAAQPAMPKQASWLKDIMKSHGAVNMLQASHSAATADSGLDPYSITSPRPTDEDLKLLLTAGEAEMGQLESSGNLAMAEEELVTSRRLPIS